MINVHAVNKKKQKKYINSYMHAVNKKSKESKQKKTKIQSINHLNSSSHLILILNMKYILSGLYHA